MRLLLRRSQGRIQDLSEGRQDFFGTKKFIIRSKKFFDLKDSIRVFNKSDIFPCFALGVLSLKHAIEKLF